jgi:hypothetical protein
MNFRKLTAAALAALTLLLAASNAYAIIHTKQEHYTATYNTRVLTFKVTLNDSRATDVDWSRFREDARQIDHGVELTLRNTYKRDQEGDLTEALLSSNLSTTAFEDALSKQGKVEKATESDVLVGGNGSPMPFDKDTVTAITAKECLGVQVEPGFIQMRERVKVTPTAGRQEKVIVSYNIEFSGKVHRVICQEHEVPRTGYGDADELSEYRRPAVTTVQTVTDEELPVNRHAAMTVLEQGQTLAVSGFHLKSINSSSRYAEDAKSNEVTVVLIQIVPAD